jgi:hypothetical protein
MTHSIDPPMIDAAEMSIGGAYVCKGEAERGR